MSAFRPLPLLGNPHVQTILGNMLGVQYTPRARRRAAPLPDGDRIALHETPPRPTSPLLPGEGPGVRDLAPIALLVHGLGGTHRSTYMQRMTQRLSGLGWRVVRMDLRGAGAGVRLARRFYNAACSGDIRAVVEHLHAVFPEAPLTVIGFSLGGNIVLKYAGECADRPPAHLLGVAVIAPPIDLVRCSDLIAGFPFYDAFYVRHLTQQVTEHQRCFPDLPRVDFPRRLMLRQFDEMYTAPRWGYRDALDYYRQASAQPWIEAIRVPTFILTARDDPFVAVESFEKLRPASCVRLHIAEHGGHMGFLGMDGAGGIRWAETRVIDWLTRPEREL